MLTVDNRSKLAFVGDLLTNPEKGGVLRIPLVGPGLDLEIGDGFGNDGVLATSTGMITRTPLFPGQTVLVFDYKTVYDQKTLSVSRSFPYPVARASFVIRANGPKAASPQLPTSETVSIDSVPSIVLSGRGFAPGDAVTVNLTGLPAPAAPTTPRCGTRASPSRPWRSWPLPSMSGSIAIGGWLQRVFRDAQVAVFLRWSLWAHNGRP